MSFVIGIDTGGTFTDGVLIRNGERFAVKVETTPHDLSLCFINCLKEGAKAVGLTLGDLLADTDIVRYGSTVASNCLVQRSGPKLGLIVDKGFEDSLYTDEEKVSLEPFVTRSMIIGVEHEVDAEGQLIKPPNADDVKKAAKDLLEKGARLIAVCLRGSAYDRTSECKIREFINEEYPPYYLGSIPILISSELTARMGDFPRVVTTVISAYVHRDVAKYLYKTDEALWKEKYARHLFIVHSDGSLSRVARSRAISTIGAGPAAGAYLAAFYADMYGLKQALSIDVGGTSCDIAVMKDGKLELGVQMNIDGFPAFLRHRHVRSIAAGGGSLAMVESGRLRIGPRSAGAVPGPACYDLGGAEPTVTDADVVLGLINPDYFLGGRKKLNKGEAIRAVKEIGDSLNIKVEEAAWEIKRTVESNIVAEATKELERNRVSPKEVTLVSYGGAGGLRCCGSAEMLGIKRVVTFPNASVFSALGTTVLDIIHIYEYPKHLTLRDKGGGFLSDYAAFNEVVGNLQGQALRDMRGEGVNTRDIDYTLELETTDGGRTFSSSVECAKIFIEKKADIEAICEAFIENYSIAKGAREKFKDSIEVEIFRLSASCKAPKLAMAACEPRGEDPKNALKGSRNVFLGDRFREVDIFECNRLECGNIVVGPAIIEGVDTVFLIPEGWKYRVDEYLNGIIEK